MNFSLCALKNVKITGTLVTIMQNSGTLSLHVDVAFLPLCLHLLKEEILCMLYCVSTRALLE